MKFYLAKNQLIRFHHGVQDDTKNTPTLQGDCTYRYQMVIGKVIPFDNNEVNVNQCAILEQLLAQHSIELTNRQPHELYGKMNLGTMDILVGILNERNAGFAAVVKGYVELQAVFSGNYLHCISSLSDGDARVQVEFNFFGSGRTSASKLMTKEMTYNSGKCEDTDVKFPSSHFKKWSSSNYDLPAEFSVIVTLPDEVLSGNYKSKTPKSLPQTNLAVSIYQQILEREVLSDVILVPSNGTEVKAHKNFLAVQSSVFLAMFENDMRETRESRVEIPDMGEASVRALLKYLYYGDTKDAEENCLVAFELFSAGHKYDIVALEQAMGAILKVKENNWYNGDVGVKLFLFARNLTPVDEELKLKAIKVVKSHAKTLMDAPTYQEIFNKDKTAAMELCQYAFMTD